MGPRSRAALPARAQEDFLDIIGNLRMIIDAGGHQLLKRVIRSQMPRGIRRRKKTRIR